LQNVKLDSCRPPAVDRYGVWVTVHGAGWNAEGRFILFLAEHHNFQSPPASGRSGTRRAKQER
jgi:hypothetical protein